MKLEVGQFVRTKHYGIFKILNIGKQNKIIFLKKAQGIDCVVADKYNPIEKEVTKASHNIIDLIEVGDYVNGYKVVSKGTLSAESKELYLAILTNDYGNFWSDKIFEQDIKTILTKEQFENNCYKIEN